MGRWKCLVLPGHEDIEGGAELIESLDLVLTNQACATELACLPSISVNESLSQPISEEWTPQMDMSPRFLQGITFFDADPKRNASIAPTSDTALPAHERIARWRFRSSGVPIWLGCRYEGTGIVLTRQLSASYKECRLVYGPGGIVKQISCD
ncbi:STY0301 family protein [Paraburkholderia sp. WSM4177]|uniref:STY0301 family protein n=1 Tax=unclassified Paraburkholderia TaxID=2615204 RepID=UPI003905AC53